MAGDQHSIGVAEAESALRWWLEAGVDALVQEQPRNWLKPTAPSESQAGEVPAAAHAEVIPETLDLFRDWLRDTPTLPLAESGGPRVLPHGGQGAEIMLLAEMPDSDGADGGRPLSGESWELAERMLRAIGIAADAAYVATLSCFQARGAPSREELESCAAIARRHVALAAPKRLLLLGDSPARALLGRPLLEARGHVHKVEGVRTVATFHPRFLLDRPANKALAWKDLLLLTEDEG